MTEARIVKRLYLRLRSGLLAAAPRFTLPGWPWEADLLAVTRAGYAAEYEVKLTRADYLRDIEKKAWSRYGGYYSRPGPTGVCLRKHELLGEGDARGPNRFSFVAPAGLLTIGDIPPWAGFIEVETHGRWLVPRFVRGAPLLHGHKSETLVALIHRALAFRFWWLKGALGKEDR